MTPLVQARMHIPNREATIQGLIRQHGFSREKVEKLFAEEADKEIWCNEVYVVVVNRKLMFSGAPMVHLSIRRQDREPVRDWRDLQAIKNQLVGEECEGFEMYPAESRKVDSANQFHLWVIADPEVRIPVGFDERFVTDAVVEGTKQRPLEEDKQ